MTTIFSNGYFLIADKRVSFTHHKSTRLPNGKADKVGGDFYIDAEAKIFLPPKGVNWNLNAETSSPIHAVGTAGEVNTTERFINLLSYLSLKETIAYFNTPAVYSRLQTFTLVFLAMDHETLVVTKRNSEHELKVTGYPAGGCTVAGSGAGTIKQLIDETNINSSNLHPLDYFLFMAAFDESSSTDYDVYCSTEHKLIRGLQPSDDAVNESVQRVGRSLVWKTVNKVKSFPCEQEHYPENHPNFR